MATTRAEQKTPLYMSLYSHLHATVKGHQQNSQLINKPTNKSHPPTHPKQESKNFNITGGLIQKIAYNRFSGKGEDQWKREKRMYF